MLRGIYRLTVIVTATDLTAGVRARSMQRLSGVRARSMQHLSGVRARSTQHLSGVRACSMQRLSGAHDWLRCDFPKR